MISVGVDPGVTGALAIVPTGGSASVFDTPTKKPMFGKRVIDVIAAKALLPEFRQSPPPYTVFIEDVGGMRGDAPSSSFNFGFTTGMWHALFDLLKIKVILVGIQSWKKAFGLWGIADEKMRKTAARVKASDLFPHLAPQLERVKDHGRAEALLIAEYGRRQNE